MSQASAGGPDGGITREARPDNLAALLAFVEQAASAAALDAESAFAVRLAVEEVCANVIGHAYAGGAPGPVTVRFRREPSAAVVTVEDRGIPFDPAAAPLPPLSGGWAERPVGGLGWHLVRETMDEVRHEPVPGGGNRVTLVKWLPAAS